MEMLAISKLSIITVGISGILGVAVAWIVGVGVEVAA
jgi:hypothetical protein